MQGSNDTKVGIGVLAGAIVTFIIEVMNTYFPELPPFGPTGAAAAVVIVTALVQWYGPPKE